MKITKSEIEKLATKSLADQYAQIGADKMIFLEGEILAAGFDISLTDLPRQWERVIDWLSDALELEEKTSNGF
jgi:hypothetical protein